MNSEKATQPGVWAELRFMSRGFKDAPLSGAASSHDASASRKPSQTSRPVVRLSGSAVLSQAQAE